MSPAAVPADVKVKGELLCSQWKRSSAAITLHAQVTINIPDVIISSTCRHAGSRQVEHTIVSTIKSVA
jgi:hypothetical protein